MEKYNKPTFEEIYKENERRIYYQMHKLGIRDPHREFYMEGLYAMWQAYKNYEPQKGTLATYFNYMIRNRLIDLLRKQAREQEKGERVVREEMLKITSGNRHVGRGETMLNGHEIVLEDDSLLKEIEPHLTERQMKWVKYRLIVGMPIKEIALQEGVSEEAVKSWGREARKKLRVQLKNSGSIVDLSDKITKLEKES